MSFRIGEVALNRVLLIAFALMVCSPRRPADVGTTICHLCCCTESDPQRGSVLSFYQSGTTV
ncbi:hypothetical protein PF005_g21529 [Phytophthora fragariae]|uniref:RxLR effector protein n=1 Tax=Phytophthora fragariae TaxID=53985 RepID=A0A6A3WJU2_9STRA|nr:hypothetical protein PF003_g31375 [Phytophthora fragariae]KAE8932563.1 hypothetical protein PF009_g17412 [Phytophthora fragariae]KAE8982627.1 hypothetical protein PF011_g21539 [Phytophthora fragariae]KAE9082763.1 hypothetical protein PF010_g21456 [Phytophthora fragariae]KAE9084493.1 hypothetical protein PF007_g21494 [Phytophthora fragariae]